MTAPRDFLAEALRTLPAKPSNDAPREPKQRYSQRLSEVIAVALAAEFRRRGLTGTRPSTQEEAAGTSSGSERRMAGGIGAKKADVTWATEESGLLLGVSVKSINFADGRSGNFQKNLTNRRGDMLFEAVTLHRRFPYAVLVGFFFLDRGASGDGTSLRRSTFENAHLRFQLFTGRDDPLGRDEQYERLFILLHNSEDSSVQAFLAGDPNTAVDVPTILDDVVNLIAARNPDFYEAVDGNLRSVR